MTLKISTTVKEVLKGKPIGCFTYKIMYNKNIPFYAGMTLKGVQPRFKTHIAKFYGDKKYPDRPNCQEIVCEHKELDFKCVGRQTHGFRTIRQIFKKNKIKFDLFNATVILTRYHDDILQDYGTELSKGKKWPLTNKFVLEQAETKIIENEIPLANDETIHLAEQRLKIWKSTKEIG